MSLATRLTVTSELLAALVAPTGFTLGPTVGTLGAGAEAGYRAGAYLGFRLDASL